VLEVRFVEELATQLSISLKQVAATMVLLSENCTVPFIARYRKEVTQNLDEVQIRAVEAGVQEISEREKRRAYILETIQKMEKLDDKLKNSILKAKTILELEDIYAPFKAKKKTKAQTAKEAGLEPLSVTLLTSTKSLAVLLTDEAVKFINAEKGIKSAEEAISGAKDIIIEKIAHDLDLKSNLRDLYHAEARIIGTKKKDAESIKEFEKFKDYFEFEETFKSLMQAKSSHRFLALRRAANLKVIDLGVAFDEEVVLKIIEKKHFSPELKLGCRDLLLQCSKRAYSVYIHPSLELELRVELKKVSDEAAIDVFSKNLKNLLLQPYLGPKAVIGVDPGVRTGCKIAVVDETGKFLLDTVIYPHEPQHQTAKSKEVMEKLIEVFKVTHIAIGNGTYGRETLEFFEEQVAPIRDKKCHATLINEDGASIYSASEIAREEFPDKDVTVRGAISIARRFQDPLSELVKIDPKSIGVGQYQHDVSAQMLQKSLNGVVESCVNFVGVDLNTASAPLLSFISGIGPVLAKNIVSYREKNGVFKSRQDLLKVSRFSDKVYEQSAGFLRIYQGSNPLDSTFIHPEKYPTILEWVEKRKLELKDFVDKSSPYLDQFGQDSELAQRLGAYTMKDILSSLKSPSQDPRSEFKSFEFRKDIKGMKDLKVNEWYPGLVTNITQFGAFVDLGIKENGLLHVSQMSDKFVENALDVLKVGEAVKVKVIEVDTARGRISLSRKGETSFAVNPTSGASSAGVNSKKKHAEAPVPKFENKAFAGLKGLKL
jgi:protein Tex